MGYATWLPEKMASYGLRVQLYPGWETRGSSYFYPGGVVCHHTASAAGSNMPSLGVVINGRPDLAGPLCNVLLARDGTCVVIAAGRANHAGSGGYRGLVGNSSVLGIEAENNGVGEPWSQAQMDAYIKLAAAMVDGINRDASWVCAHREWTSRKIDPTGINMGIFRAAVADTLGSGGFDWDAVLAAIEAQRAAAAAAAAAQRAKIAVLL